MCFFFKVIVASAGNNHRVELRDHDSTLCEGPKLPSCQLIHKVAEDIIVLFLALRLLNGQLQLALDFPHEEVVDDNVVGRGIKLIFYSYKFELAFHAVAAVEHVHRPQQTDKLCFSALELGAHEVGNSEDDQIEVMVSSA